MNTFEAFRFAEPAWALALWAVAFFLVLLLWLDQRSSRALDRLISPALQEQLVTRPGSFARIARIFLFGLSAVCVVLALMRPQGEMHSVQARQSGAELMIALDVSNSMLAEDVAPNRLERAKAEIVDLLGYLDGDQVGLIAFAGRASLISPLTPDFGFVRLVLSEVGPGSAARGGTRLEEPIRKAVAGFARPGADADSAGSRALILITDGEDHGSFPLDAAKAAAQAGIVVIAIGIGDEEGSEIRITNPKSGVRAILRDADGQPVRTRLDGDLLRAIALETGGAYVPAGTATLDLESIYREYIGPMTRGRIDSSGRTVRDELYPWFVLLGLVLLVASVGVGALPQRVRSVAAALVCGLLAIAPVEVRAQGAAPSNPEFTTGSEESELSATPRERFNEGYAALEARDFDEAISKIERARDESRGDGELRFRAAYDLGWLAVQKAGRTEGESPRDALTQLYRGVDWFREALALRPEDNDTRENLEVAQLRALQLEDRLARQGDGGVEEQLDELTQRQRGLLEAVALLYHSTAAALAGGDPNATDTLRPEFRAQASAQRLLLADANLLANQLGGERDALSSRSAEEREPTDEMRAVQLGNALHYLHRAQERMGRARSQLRRRQGATAYHQASGALFGLKRARDQFREPVAMIDVLLAEQGALAQRTHEVLSARQGIASQTSFSEGEPALAAEQNSLAGRTGELDARLRSVSEGAAGPQASPPGGAASAQAAQIAALREARPFIERAHQRLLEAGEDLDARNLQGAQVGQYEGLQALKEARERFLDLRGLIEAAHADQVRIVEVLAQLENADEILRTEYRYSVRNAQSKNLGRTERVAEEIDAKQRELSGGEGAPPGADPLDPEMLRQEMQRMDAARDILGRVQAGMKEAQEQFGHAAAWETAGVSAQEAVRELENLRRLFFTIVEHIREVLRQEIELIDRTRDAGARAASASDAAVSSAPALAAAQAKLAERTLSIANALVEQSDLAPPDEPEAEKVSQTLREAAEHVVVAEMEMGRVSAPLVSSPPEFSAALPFQKAAAVELAEAVALLVPPPPEEEPESPDNSEEQQDSGEPEPQDADPGEDPQPPEPALDPAQLLQAVRDQEAQRRRERAARAQNYDAVEKDW